jgi:DNA-binding LytR/AlgR family response regulator
MLTCYLIDDDDYAIEALTKYIDKVPWLSVIGSNTNPIHALAEIQSGAMPDIVFLDVEMPELSGIELAKLLPKELAVVFTTSYKEYAFNAFQQDAVDFLLKPFSFETFLKCVNKLRNKTSPLKQDVQKIPRPYLYVNPGVKGRIVQVDLAMVTHIEAIEHSVCFHLLTEKITTNISIKKIQEKLPPSSFVRIHRTFIVNVSYAKTIEANLIMLSTGTQIPLGEAYRAALMRVIKG